MQRGRTKRKSQVSSHRTVEPGWPLSETWSIPLVMPSKRTPGRVKVIDFSTSPIHSALCPLNLYHAQVSWIRVRAKLKGLTAQSDNYCDNHYFKENSTFFSYTFDVSVPSYDFHKRNHYGYPWKHFVFFLRFASQNTTEIGESFLK